MRLYANNKSRFQGVAALLLPAFLTLATSSGPLSAQSSVVVQSQPVATSGVVCAKCGRIHASSPAVSSSSPIVQSSSVGVPTSGVVRQTSATVSSNGASNVLQTLNSQRSRQGLRSLRYDPTLQAVAERRAAQMARMGTKSHPPGSFAPGRYEGVGWSSSFSPSGVHACYTSNPNMTAAGAAMVTGRDGVYFAVVYR
ncbi:CAP domain-containing protein [Stieleria sp. TO1_6]|uniref:CAP domain-containing protein n=1 Tax=Stieleria tagensis TaxID=2956795 RepID=UPI00209AB5E3|nr:CAP domain-containing protein [Stieleria tagensis]MCO8121163.1 CAP domain-containing protein [Stieleria tagensis]